MNLAGKTIRGVLWSFSEHIGRRGINVVVTLVLTRFLAPEDFGLMGVMSSVLAIAGGLMDSGFRLALIRREDATQADYNTAFFSNIGLGVAAYAIVYAAAPTIAGFYDEPDIGVLTRAGGVVILINAFSVVQNAVLSREFDFRSLLLASVPASLISGVAAVVLAYLGFGIWALIGQMILNASFSSIFLWRNSSWRPTLAASRRSFHEMFSFGSRMFAATALDTVFNNLYVIVIAKVFYVSIAGYYFFADRIKELIINQLVSSIKTVTYPAFSTIQNDNSRLKDGYRKVLQVTTFTLFPAMSFLAALSKPLFDVFLPDIWAPAVPYLQLLCLAGIMIPVHMLNLNILQVKGRSDLFLRLEILKKTMLMVVLVISLKFGIFGILIGRVIASVLGYFPNSYYSGKLINYPIREQIVDFLPALFLSSVIGGLVYASVTLLDWAASTELAVFGMLSGPLYLALAYLFKMEALDLAMRLTRRQYLREV